jgi:hypothetical protein
MEIVEFGLVIFEVVIALVNRTFNKEYTNV